MTGFKKVFIIDIDGTICEHVRNEDGVEPMRRARPFQDSLDAINKLYDEGHFICFFTARTDEHIAVTKEWLEKHKVKYHQLIVNKPRKIGVFKEYHFIDDAPVRATTYKGKFTSFVKKTREIEDFE